jgi:hypothetical protein
MTKSVITAERITDAVEVSFKVKPRTEAERGLLALFTEAATQDNGPPVLFDMLTNEDELTVSIRLPARDRSVKPEGAMTDAR